MSEKFDFTKKGSVLDVTVRGRFSENDGKNFIQTYQSTVSSMPDKQELHMDCTELQVTTTDLVDMLTGCFEMYKQDFPKATMYIKDDALLKMQLSRLGRKVGLDLTIDIKK